MRRLRMIEISEILYRKQKGDKIKQIAKSLGYSKNTIKSVIKDAVIYRINGTDMDSSDQIATAISKVRRKRPVNPRTRQTRP